MTNDIKGLVERLRTRPTGDPVLHALVHEAADEIERLSSALAQEKGAVAIESSVHRVLVGCRPPFELRELKPKAGRSNVRVTWPHDADGHMVDAGQLCDTLNALAHPSAAEGVMTGKPVAFTSEAGLMRLMSRAGSTAEFTERLASRSCDPLIVPLYASPPAVGEEMVTDAMVERACEAFRKASGGYIGSPPAPMRAALSAAMKEGG